MLSTALLSLTVCLSTLGQGTTAPSQQSLKLFNIHTKESATIVFKRNGAYDRAGLKKINRFLRDWRTDEPTKMDPALLDLIWDVYRRSGSSAAINVVSGYRSPATNGKLRRRSKGVAKNSLHIRGRAMDFYLPDVKLATLRKIGLKLHFGGVGYYPGSGAPFVHMDTGRVRHWPRMSRKQLVAVFPSGRTMHVPSDGKPLAGYALAKADYDARRSGRRTAVASLDTSSAPAARPARPATGKPIAVTRPVAVAVASYDPAPVPLPRFAPRPVAKPLFTGNPLAPVILAPIQPGPAPITVASANAGSFALDQDFDFGPAQDWIAPAVPSNLAAAMAERDQSRRGASLPIPPTSVVATITVSRPLRAGAITSAVLRGKETSTEPALLAYAPPTELVPRDNITPNIASLSGVPVPRANPFRRTARRATRSIVPESQYKSPQLTLTTLDTHGLRSWIGPGSTRQRSFAVLTMLDPALVNDLIDEPRLSYVQTFGGNISTGQIWRQGSGVQAFPDLRTDRFATRLVRQPLVVTLIKSSQ